jgi:hypothetical protein
VSKWFQRLSNQAKALTVIVGLVSALIAALVAWDNFVVQKTTCSFSGVASHAISGEPEANVVIGYDPNYVGNVNSGRRPQVTVLARSGADGRFAGDCGGIHDAVSDDSFELLYFGGTSVGGLPCLEVRSTHVRIRNRGEHDGLAIVDFGC